MNKILALDLGASSGRAILGTFENDKRLKLEEIYRFPNKGVQVGNELHWDVPYIFNEIKKALSIYVKNYGTELRSIGVDTWGVSYILLDKNNDFLSPMYHYRDKRTVGMLEKMFEVVPKEEIFRQTGIQFLELNSSTQIFSLIYKKSDRLSKAAKFLMFPDYLNYLLSGVLACECSNATTTQLYNPIKKEWAFDLIKRLGLSPELFINIIPGGTILGPIKDDLAKEVGLSKQTRIIAPLTHDTASAYASVPVEMNKYNEGEYGILSSGTWSLLGVELKEPLINEKALNYNYSNEGGFNGTIRFLKNLTGMWLIQECKKLWDKEEKKLSWEEILTKAENSQNFQYYINPDDHRFLNPPNMIEAIQNFCKDSNQNIPKTIGEISNTIFASLAFRYKQAVENLEDILEKKLKIFHIIGGGSQNTLLNQFTANILNIPVEAGPSEATAIGNLSIQALTLGIIKDISELRQIVRNSFKIKKFLPQNTKIWNKEYKKYLEIIS
ncbi:MAG: rhamnulokinase [Promethearchaeota archaeon]